MVAPDGDRAYQLGYRGLAMLDLVTGTQRAVAEFPRPGAGLAVTAARVYVADPFGSVVWAVERR